MVVIPYMQEKLKKWLNEINLISWESGATYSYFQEGYDSNTPTSYEKHLL